MLLRNQFNIFLKWLKISAFHFPATQRQTSCLIESQIGFCFVQQMTIITTKQDFQAGQREQEGLHPDRNTKYSLKRPEVILRKTVYLQGALIPIDFENKITVIKPFLLSVLLLACQICCLKNRAERTSLECHSKGVALQ